MDKIRILVVDDEEGMLEVYADSFQQLPDVEVILEQDSTRAAKRLAKDRFDLLISDIRMPDIDGMGLLETARQHDPTLGTLMVTAYPTVETAVNSMKLGALDYIVKPFNPVDLLSTVRHLLENKRLREENLLLRRQVERSYVCGEILGQSMPMQQIFEKIKRVAASDIDVLIAGETGTGKELVARAIHQHSPRHKGPFVPVDCGSIPDELMESEFFGHERGAYTGAQSRACGLLEYANHGTFFLDELSQLTLRLQAKLLRVLQERKIRRVGGSEEIDLDVRVITAFSLDLEDRVKKGQFRLDLYHRIRVAHIDLPPLRARGDDIALLAEHFLARYAKEMGKGPVSFSPEVMEVLTSYPWPGNVRELQNVIKRTLVMLRHPVITLDDVPDDIVARAGEIVAQDGRGYFALRELRLLAFEKEYLKNLLTQFRGDVTAATREAALPRGTLYRLLKKHDLEPVNFRA